MLKPDRLVRRREVYSITGMSRYLIDLLEEAGEFPARVRVGQRAVFWSLNEVTAFVERTKEGCRLVADGSPRAHAEQSQPGHRP